MRSHCPLSETNTKNKHGKRDRWHIFIDKYCNVESRSDNQYRDIAKTCDKILNRYFGLIIKYPPENYGTFEFQYIKQAHDDIWTCFTSIVF